MPLGNGMYLKIHKVIFCLTGGMVGEKITYSDKGIDEAREMLWEVTKLVSGIQLHG